MSFVPSSPKTGTCRRCGATLLFDGSLRNNKGKIIPFEIGYKIHDCRPESQNLTDEEKDMRAVKYLLWRMHKLNRGLKTCKMTLTLTYEDGKRVRVNYGIPTKPKQKPVSVKPEQQPLTPMQRLLINSRL